MNSPVMQGLALNTPAHVKHARLIAWVADMAALCKPDSIYWCDGSQEEYDRLCQQLRELRRGHGSLLQHGREAGLVREVIVDMDRIRILGRLGKQRDARAASRRDGLFEQYVTLFQAGPVAPHDCLTRRVTSRRASSPLRLRYSNEISANQIGPRLLCFSVTRSMVAVTLSSSSKVTGANHS